MRNLPFIIAAAISVLLLSNVAASDQSASEKIISQLKEKNVPVISLFNDPIKDKLDSEGEPGIEEGQFLLFQISTCDSTGGITVGVGQGRFTIALMKSNSNNILYASSARMKRGDGPWLSYEFIINKAGQEISGNRIKHDELIRNLKRTDGKRVHYDLATQVKKISNKSITDTDGKRNKEWTIRVLVFAQEKK